MMFTATLEQHGKTAAGVEVPDEVVASLGGGKRPPVVVTVNGHTWRSTIAVYGGTSLLGVAAEHRVAASVAAGELIDVDVTLDTQPRVYEPPEDFAAAIAAAGVRERWDALAPSHRKEHVRAIEEAKKPETRERRIAKAIEMLRS